MQINGKLTFFSETGTEGGYWAFQDHDYIKLEAPDFGIRENREVWDSNDLTRRGFTLNSEFWDGSNWIVLPDPIYQDKDYKVSSLNLGEVEGDRLADKRLMEKYQFTIEYSEQRFDRIYGEGKWRRVREGTIEIDDGSIRSSGLYPSTSPKRPYNVPKGGLTKVTIRWEDGQIEYERRSDTLLLESWDYKGLHILKDGDRLTIKSPLTDSTVWEGQIELQRVPLFSETARGLWIHADQKGILREEWSKFFFEEYPGVLETLNDSTISDKPFKKKSTVSNKFFKDSPYDYVKALIDKYRR